MNLPEIKKENLSKIIIRELGEYIINNNLKSGDKLPTEHELVNMFNVSRSAIREALKVLELIGLVKSKPRVGTVLSTDGAEPFLLPFFFGVILEDSSLEFLSEMRLIIEQGAASLAAKQATDNELEKLMKIAKELDTLKSKDSSTFSEKEEKNLLEKEIQFHKRLVELSHNPILIKFSSLWDVFFTRVYVTGDLYMASDAGFSKKVKTVKHAEIVQTLIERNSEAALKCINTHLTIWQMRTKEISKEVLVKLVRQR